MMKNQKGITLVALIITIIVMLILVAVTISIALNGGIFEKARDASEKTLKAQLEEAVMLAKADVVMYYYENGARPGVEEDALALFNPASYLDSKWTKVDCEPVFDEEFDVTFSNNGNEFTIEDVLIPTSSRTSN